MQRARESFIDAVQKASETAEPSRQQARTSTTESQRAAVAELQKLYDDIKGRENFADEYGVKNLEEFVSELLSNRNLRAKIDQTAGLLRRIYNTFLKLLGFNPQSLSEKALDNAYALFQPSGAPRVDGVSVEGVASVLRGVFPATRPAADASVSDDIVKAVSGTVGRHPNVTDKVTAAASGILWRTALLDRWAPVEELLKRAEAKAEGAKGRIAEAQALGARFAMRVYEQVNQFVGTAVSDGVPQLGKADEMGVRTIEGVSGANMRKVADALAKAKVGNSEFTEQMFTTWLAILRAEQDGVGLAKLNFTTQLTDAQIAKIKNRVNSDPDTKAAFEEARKIYRQYNKDLMQLMVDTGVLDKEKAAELTAGDYVPYYRDNKGVVEMVVGNSKPVRIGSVVDQPELKALLGGDDKILPVFAGALQNTSMLMRMALRNMQTHDVANLLKDMGMGEILPGHGPGGATSITDRKSTRLNSSH